MASSWAWDHGTPHKSHGIPWDDETPRQVDGNPWGPSWDPMESAYCPGVHSSTGTYDLVDYDAVEYRMGSYDLTPWDPMGPYGTLQVYFGMFVGKRLPMRSHCMSHGIPRNLRMSRGFTWIFMEFSSNPLGAHEISRGTSLGFAWDNTDKHTNVTCCRPRHDACQSRLSPSHVVCQSTLFVFPTYKSARWHPEVFCQACS